ncbi:GIN domain-containing protein [Pseudomonas protegens]|uniref:GIN domain-containing protein n=1 Tax=Pseudomonas protegens TaxID=380021 RepID=UPI0038250A71
MAHLNELNAATVDLSVAGSGDISAYASQSARARVAGSGDILVYGKACTENPGPPLHHSRQSDIAP